MAWVVTRDLALANGAQVIYALKEALKAQGWTVLMSGDGLAVYNAAGDSITHNGAGANGMNNALAWFRIEDPASANEWVFQQGSWGVQYWTILRSVAAGFVGGAPAAAQRPTAADEQTCTELTLTEPFGVLIFAGAGAILTNIGVQSAAHNGIYAFYCVSHASGVGTFENIVAQESMNSAITSGDADPAVVIATGASPTQANLGRATDQTSGIFTGMSGAEWAEYAALMPKTTGGATPPTETHPDAAGNYRRSTIDFERYAAQGAQPTWKGQAYHFRWSPSSAFAIPDILDTAGGAPWYMIFFGLALPWDSAVPPTL